MFCGHNRPASGVFAVNWQFCPEEVQLSLPIRKPKPVPGCRAPMKLALASYFAVNTEFLAVDCGQFVPARVLVALLVAVIVKYWQPGMPLESNSPFSGIHRAGASDVSAIID